MAAFSAEDLREIDIAPKEAAAPRVNPHAKELNILAEEMAKFKREFQEHRGDRSAAQAEGRRANHSGVAAPRHEPWQI